MRNNETGEFELLVGNRQLLSGFFIVVLLFAVAFSMGYIVGRNSAPSAKLPAETASSSGTASQMPETHPQPVAQAPAAGGAPEATPPGGTPPADAAQGASPGAPPVDTAPQPSTQPERAAGPGGTPPAMAATQTAAAPGPEGTPEAAPGAYWQVLATASQTSADAMRQTMKDKGFPASLQPGPNNLIRVLIGPYNDKQSLGRAKTELENAGLHPVLK
ncbi:MAG: SPOR domain-containing protein [Bryobacteraceae bacterium]|jgi:cell division septation protein DedD